VCSDQEAVDLIRNIQDPQAASKALVDHALARFSTDNLSCMVIRFDSQRVQATVNAAVEPIGVDGDPSSRVGGVSEGEAIVREQERKMKATGDGPVPLEKLPSDYLYDASQAQKAEVQADPGPELNAQAVEAARKDR
jgi:protein phosphatase PTC1